MEEAPSRIEPCFFSEGIPSTLSDLVEELHADVGGLGQGLHSDVVMELADVVRVANCHYSNLIEGHNAGPKDIERALAGVEIGVANGQLALEGKAHVVVQRRIDQMFFDGKLPSPTSADFISWVHREFYEAIPDEFKFAERHDGTYVPIIPGGFRKEGDDEVVVGRHQPPSSHRVLAFMVHFSNRYRQASASTTSKIISIAAAHHRLNYIHPFPDGNGRVSRLMSHAMALDAGVGGNGLWSISRGLALGLREKTEYKRMMDHADHPRMGDRDGRGNLSEKALETYCEWFLCVVLDQVRFSTSVFDFESLESRYRKVVSAVTDDKRALDIISAGLRHGALNRSEINLVTKTSVRTAQNTLTELVQAGFLKPNSSKTHVRIAFPVDYWERLLPNLFKDAEIDVTKPGSRS